MDWVWSDTVEFSPLLKRFDVPCGILFMMSLIELKLSDCGTLKITGL